MVNRKQWVYGALSVVCPILIVGAVLAFQAVAYPSIASSSDPPDDADRHAAVLMAVAEFGELLLATTVGCLLGVILAIRTLKLQKRWFGIGLVGLVLNGLPLVFLGAFWIRHR
jgi:hypothetical protein